MRRHQSQEGAVLFIVLITIMLATASAIFAIHTAAIEVRGTGFARQQVQAKLSTRAALYAGLDWFESNSAESIRMLIQEDGAVFVGNEPEVNLAPGKKVLRLLPEYMALLKKASPTAPGLFEHLPFSDTDSFGRNVSLQATNVVDIYDERISNQAVAGERADGGGTTRLLKYTLTARGVASVPTDVLLNTRGFNSVGQDMRAYVTSAPTQVGQ